MTLTLRTDTSRPGGGFAILEGPGLAGLGTITIENVSSGQFLGDNGKWGRHPFAFPVEEGPAASLLLGPHIVDLVPTDLLVELRAEAGATLGRLFWADVIPSRNPGSITSAQVLDERRRRAEKRAADEREAGEKAAREQEAREREAREREAQEGAAKEQAAKEREAQERDAKEAEARAAEQRAAAEAAARDGEARLRAEQERAEKERAAQAEKAAAEAGNAEARAEAERRAADKAEADRLAAASTPAAAGTAAVDAQRPTRWALIAAAVLLPLAAAGTAVALRPSLLGWPHHGSPLPATDDGDRRQASPDPADPGPEAAHDRQEDAAIKPVPTPAPVDCASFAGRLAEREGRTDLARARLGEEALRAGCGSEAFLAFDGADPQVSETTAWHMARFYDPNERDPVYRRAASIHADYAAGYYWLWRNRSSRQAAALAMICETEHSASLARYCDR